MDFGEMQSPQNQCSQSQSCNSPSNSVFSTPSTQRSLPADTQCTPTIQNGSAPTPSSSYKSAILSPCAAATQTKGTPGFHSTPSPGYNPFESANEHLLVTPGLFQTRVSSPTQEKKCYWEFEQSAMLNPTDLGDVKEKAHEQERRNKKYEQMILAASNEFWKNHHVIAASPSPSTQQLSQKRVHYLSRIDEEQKSVCNASCQTDIHLPPSLDVQELLKDHMLSASQVEELNKGDSFSNSSLRRKLFDNGEGFSDSNPSTPEKSFSPLNDNFLNSPPLSSLHSSSPVFGSADEHCSVRRRCSLTQNIDGDFSPPDVSPINSPAAASVEDGLSTLPADVSMIHAIPRRLSPGRLCLTDDEEEAVDAGPDNCVQDMSVYQHPGSTVEPCARNNLPSQSFISPPLPDQNPTVSMNTVADNSHMQQSSELTGMSFGAPSASDTGYQSQSATSKYFMDDLSSIHQSGTHQPQSHQHNKSSPNKANPSAWTPPSSSTPTKASIATH